MTIKATIDNLVTTAGLVYSWAFGSSTTSVTFGSYTVHSPAKLIADWDAAINTSVTSILSQVNASKQLAQDWATKTSAEVVSGQGYGAKYYKDAAQTTFNSFDARYLGAFATDPTLNNQGGALATGALYWYTGTGGPYMKAYNGSAWAATAGGALLAANNFSDVANAATARTNLGLGSANSPQFVGVALGGSAGSWSASTKYLQMPGGSLFAYGTGETHLTQNAIYTGSGWQYVNTGVATDISQVSGEIRLSSAASGSAGAALTFTQNYSITSTSLKPASANTVSLGASSYAWQNIYTQNAVTVTSDARTKALRNTTGALTETEIAAALDVQHVVYQLNQSISEKGADKARLHIGHTAQQVAEVFEAHGLDASRYSFFCRDDVVEDVPAVDAKGKPIMESYIEPVLEDVPETVTEVQIVDGQPVLKQIERVTQQPVLDMLPVVDEAGELVVDGEGQPVLHAVPRMATKQRQVTERKVTGYLLSLRYDELQNLIAAAQAAEIKRLRELVQGA